MSRVLFFGVFLDSPQGVLMKYLKSQAVWENSREN